MKNHQFSEYALSESIMKAIEGLGYDKPTKVQQEAIPLLLEGKDIVVKSQTGSGKTASFAIPIVEKIQWDENPPQALVITPTRELAMQVKEDFFNLGRFKRLKISVLIGKAPFHLQEKELKQKTHVAVGTPGRIIDHIDRGTIDLSGIKYLVIDEADEMLRMGFIEQVEYILDALPKERCSALLSATMPEDIQGLCQHYLSSPELIEIEDVNPVAERIEQRLFHIPEREKENLLLDLLAIENPDSCMVFCNTQLKVDELEKVLQEMNIYCDRIHGGMEQRDRLSVMDHFKKGKFRVLVATDVAARGIDVEQVDLVINYDVPNHPENYVHRIGRTGRIGNLGKAIIFASPGERDLLEGVEDYIEREIPKGEAPTREAVLNAAEAFEEKQNRRPKLKEAKGDKLNDGIVKLHINAGKKTKMRAVDIVGTLCSLEGITSDDIGIINIMDISTFVEILNGKGDFVLKALQDKPIKGRLRKVSKSGRC